LGKARILEAIKLLLYNMGTEGAKCHVRERVEGVLIGVLVLIEIHDMGPLRGGAKMGSEESLGGACEKVAKESRSEKRISPTGANEKEIRERKVEKNPQKKFDILKKGVWLKQDPVVTTRFSGGKQGG